MRLYLGGYLDFYHPQRRNRLDVTLRQHTPLNEVLTELGIPLGEVHLVVINGEVANLRESRVSEQDEVKLFSAVGGG